MVRLWNSMVDRVVKGAERSEVEAEPERRVAWVDGERVFGLGRWVDGGIEMTREVAEQRLTTTVSSDDMTRSILGLVSLLSLVFG